MSTDLLVKEFDLLFDAVGSVPKLRALILDLAVRGKLVPQDPADEPASVLLERIEAEKQRLYKASKIRKPKKLPAITEEEHPFDLPIGWVWTRLGIVRHDWGQKSPNQKFSYLDVSAINKEEGVVGDDYDVLEPENAPSRARKLVRKGTVIYSTVRPYLLNIAIIERDYEPEPIVSTAFAIMHPCQGLDASYLTQVVTYSPVVML